VVAAAGAATVAQAAAAASVGALAVVEVGVDAPDGGVAASGPKPPTRWNNNTSGFVLMRMAQILSDGSRTDKLFKDKDVNCVAKALREYTGNVVSPTQVYNHLRK
jgi:formylmethanofuran:tetrahydromethanopterin formyltransferase